MTDSAESPEVLIEPPSEPSPVRKPRRWPWALVLLLLVGVAVLVGLKLHASRQSQVHQQSEAQLKAEQAARTDAALAGLDTRLAALERGLDQLRQTQQSLGQRLEANAATNQVLREELLGMGERAGLLEDAVARLGQSRLGGESVLRLNEAEFLLSMGAERLNLYADVAAAIQAFELAEGALASLDDPSLATLRQTLAQELIQLRNVPPDPRPVLRAELAELATRLTTLPGLDGRQAPQGQESSRFERLFGKLVTVRRIDAGEALLGPAQRQAALAAIALQLERAQAALARPDQTELRAALMQARQGAQGVFDAGDAQVKAWFERVDTLMRAELVPQLPVLGATLRELRALRGTRRVAAGGPLNLPGPEEHLGAEADAGAGAESQTPPSETPEPALEPQVEPEPEAQPSQNSDAAGAADQNAVPEPEPDPAPDETEAQASATEAEA